MYFFLYLEWEENKGIGGGGDPFKEDNRML